MIFARYFALLSLLISVPVAAQWPDRHGPELTGEVDEKDAAGLPIHWSETENIAWKTPLHDEGHSSPVILDGKVWLTAANLDGTKQFVIGIDEETGSVLHDELLFENEEVETLGAAAGFNNYAAPSCVLSSGAVYAHFGCYGTAKLDAQTAKVVWQRRDLPCRHFRGPGSSPLVYDDKLILTFDGIDQQYTVALNSETGETIWRTNRSTDYGDLDENGLPKSEGDLRKAYCTPGIANINGQVQLLSVGSKAMQSYDLKTGRELWTVRHSSYNAGIRPLWLPKEGLVLFNSGSRGAQLIAVKVDPSTQGDVTETHVAWIVDNSNPRFAKPIYHDGLVYQVNDLGVATCIDAANGKEIWKGRVPGNYRSSPILAGEHLYFFSEEGVGTILKIGRSFEKVASHEVSALGTTACPAASKKALFIRGKTHLFKIKQP